MRLLIHIPFLIGLLVAFQQTSTFADKPVPVLGEKAFVAKFLVTMVNEGKTMYVTEKYDETQNKTSLESVSGDERQLLIMDYQDQVVAKFISNVRTKQNTKCQLFSMEYALTHPEVNLKDNFHVFGGWRNIGSTTTPKIFKHHDVLSLGDKSAFKYQKKDYIDGIEVDKWSAPMSWSEDKDTFTVDLYFTTQAWTAAESLGKRGIKPMRIEIKGQKTGVGVIHHIYDYLDFVTKDRLAIDAFEYPMDFDCEQHDTSTIKDVPKIPDVISYGREIIDRKGNVDYADVVYDKKMKLMEITRSQNKVLYDFNSGVRYESIAGKCSPRAIDPVKDHNSDKNGDFVKDIGPAEFAMLNESLIYMGTGHSRAISTFNFMSDDSQKQGFKITFANRAWNFPSNYNSPPLSLVLGTNYYNFFDFRNDATSLRTSYLWGACRQYNETTLIKIRFYAKGLSNLRDELLSDKSISLIYDAITKASWLANSQVQILKEPSYSDHSGHLIIYARLFAPPQALYMYRKTDSTQLTGKPSKVAPLGKGDPSSIRAKSPDLCEETAASTPFDCKSYDVCVNKDSSYTMTMYSPDTIKKGATMKQNVNCDHYTRSVNTNGGVSLNAALQNLKDAATKGFLRFRYKSHSRYHSEQSIIAVSVDTADWSGNKKDEFSARSKFDYVRGMNLKHSEVLDVKTAEDCARLCLAKDIYKCKAVRMCYPTNECVLSEDFPYKDTSYRPSRSCSTYKRSFTSEFKEMPGSTMLYGNKYMHSNVPDANTCASKCIGSKDISCESFDFCKDSKECVLSKHHIYSVPADKVLSVQATCSHFSKNYVQDFDISTHTAISSSDKHVLQTIKVATPEKCAYLCRHTYVQSCVQFDYCSDKTICQIVTKSSKGYVSHVPKGNCDTYTLKDAQKVIASGKMTADKGTTYSNASFGGLAFAMLVVGLIIGGGILFILHRRGSLSRFTS